MSGPKVVHIVTRQEVLEICQVCLSEVDCAIDEWIRIAEQNSLPQADGLSKCRAMRETIAQLIAEERFLEVQKRGPQVAEAIRDDLVQRIEQLELEKAGRQARQRSLRTTAAAVLKQCRQDYREVAQQLESLLASPATSMEELDAAVGKAIMELSKSHPGRTSTVTQDLARQLGATDRDMTLEEWLASEQTSVPDPRLRKIQDQLSQLIVLGDSPNAVTLAARHNALLAETDNRRQVLMADSLLLELAVELKAAKLRNEVRLDLSHERAAAQSVGDMAVLGDQIRELESQLERGQIDEAREGLQRLKQLRSDRARQRAGQNGREAILRGLQALGYEVREGMTTTWQRDKQLVIRHPQKSGIALELAGSAENGRVQARVVAVQGSSQSGEEQKHAEEQWCKELARIQTLIAQGGGALKIEKATAAGAIPLKVVSDSWQSESIETTDSHRRQLHP